MGCVLSVAVVSGGTLIVLAVARDGTLAKLSDDAFRDVLHYLPAKETCSLGSVSHHWNAALLDALTSRWDKPKANPSSILCLNSRRIAECAKWLRDENKDKGDQSAVLLTPMANVHFSFGEDDPVHPLGLHPCTVYSRAHPKGRHTMWQLIDGDLSELGGFFDDHPTPNLSCQLCKIRRSQKIKLIRNVEVPLQSKEIDDYGIDYDLNLQVLLKGERRPSVHPIFQVDFTDEDPSTVEFGHIDSDPISEVKSWGQRHQKFDIVSLLKCYLKNTVYEPFIYRDIHQDWVTGDVLVRVFIEDTQSNDDDMDGDYLVLFDSQCRSVRMCVPIEMDKAEIRLINSLITITDTDRDVSYHYCSDVGTLLAVKDGENQKDHCELCECTLPNEYYLNSMKETPDWNDLLCHQLDEQTQPESTTFKIYQKYL